MVIKIDENTFDSFAPLIPEEVRKYAEDGETFCLGSVRDDTAAGILVFSMGDGLDVCCDTLAMATVQWLFTAEDFRHQGVANELMDALEEVIQERPETIIACFIPDIKEVEDLEAFFSFRGFEFEDRGIPLMTITKDDCREQKTLNPAGGLKKPRGIAPLDEIPKYRFRATIKKMLEDEEFLYYSNLSYDRDVYHRGMSFAIMNGDEISSIVLFRRILNDELHMVMLDAMAGADPREILELLKYSAGSYYLNEPDRLKIKLTLWKEKSQNLAAYIFPKKKSVLIRRGYKR